jgi:hypothetical protein
MAMKLSAELFDQIISNLRSDGTRSSGVENRSQARVGLRCGLEISPCEFTAKNAKPIAVFVHDLSHNGIGLVSPVKFDEGSEFVAKFSRDGHPAVPVLYKVRHCRRISRELVNIGASLERVLPDASGEIVPRGEIAKSQLRKTAKPRPQAGKSSATA